MKKIISLVIIVLVFSVSMIAEENTNKSEYETEYTGFFSTSYTILDNKSNFDFGALEIDIARQLSRKFSLEGALAVENGEASVEGFLSMSIDKHTARIGRFDLPFGYEYRIADPHMNKFESLSILTTDLVGEVWNGDGINVNTSISSFEVNGYVINSEAMYKMGGIQIINNSIECLETGLSLSSVLERDKIEKLEGISNFYSKLSLEDIELVGEVTTNQATEGIGSSREGWGYYLQGLYNVDQIELPLYVGARYGHIDYDTQSNISQVSAGLGYKITETNLIKMFYKNREGNSSLVLETGVSF